MTAEEASLQFESELETREEQDIKDDSTIISKKNLAILKRYLSDKIKKPENPLDDKGFLKFDCYSEI